jgi:PTS system mannose-specific IIA component
MVGVLFVSHGRLAEALIYLVQSLIGNLQRIKRVSVRPQDRRKEVDDGDGALILTDILGGASSNLSQSILEEEKIKVVIGVNMPMLLTLSSYRKGRSSSEIGKLKKSQAFGASS